MKDKNVCFLCKGETTEWFYWSKNSPLCHKCAEEHLTAEGYKIHTGKISRKEKNGLHTDNHKV